MCGSSGDPFVTYLKSAGYNAVRLPRASLVPTTLLFVESRKAVSELGALDSVFQSSQALPAARRDEIAADISGKSTGELSFGLGLSLLGNILAAFGAGKVGIDLAYKGARTAVFEFEDVKRDSVSVADLDRYFASADVRPDSPMVSKLLDADAVLAMTACIKSTKFTLDADSQRTGSVKVDIPVIQAAVGANVSVAASRGSTAKVTFEGTVPLIFGFQAVRLIFENGAYRTMKPTSDAALKTFGSAAAPNGSLWVSDANFVSVP